MLQLLSLLVALVLSRFFRPPRRGYLYCGIAGFSGHRAADETKLRFLLVENQPRGIDSTGVYGNNLYKNNVPAKEFIQSPGFKSAVRGAKTVGMHTRAASYGLKTQANAHPFLYGEDTDYMCVGGHNGFVVPEMLKYHTKNLGFVKECDVDSMLIFAAIAKTKDFKIISKIEGAMSLWFILPNKDPNTIYLYRRSNTRDLAVGQAREGIYFSSEVEPLKLIGCTNVFNAAGDVLYTIRNGEIIDRFLMPLPILKSLGVNVPRSDWRRGLPHAEVTALPISVYSQSQQSAKESKTDPYRSNNYDLYDKGESVYSNGKASNQYGKSPKLPKYTGQFNDLDDFDNDLIVRANMLIASVTKELEGVAVKPIEFANLASFSFDDFNGCILHVKLLTTNSIPIAAWTVHNIDQIEQRGITGHNGIASLKIPGQFCGKGNVKFHVYDPVDALGAYSFEIEPEHSRVMEVTLRLPFLEEIDEKKVAKLSSHAKHQILLLRSSMQGSLVHLPTTTAGGSQQPNSGKNLPVLREKSSEILPGSEQGPINGPQLNVANTSALVPERETETTPLEYHKLLPNQNSPSYINNILIYILSTDGFGLYINWQPEDRIKAWMKHNPERLKYINIYAKSDVANEIEYLRLIDDALRCMGYDREKQKQWYKVLSVYIVWLLKKRPYYYIKRKGMTDISQYFPITLWNKRTVKGGVVSAQEIAPGVKLKISAQHYHAFLLNSFGFKLKKDMEHKNLEKLDAELSIFDDSLGKLRVLLTEALTNEDQSASSAIMKLKEAAKAAKDFFTDQQEHVMDLRDEISHRLSKKKEEEPAID